MPDIAFVKPVMAAIIIEPLHIKGGFGINGNSKDPDQPVVLSSLIKNSAILCYVPYNTVDSRYLDLAYLE